MDTNRLFFGPGPSDPFPVHVVPKAMKHLVWWDTSLLLNEFLECLTVPYRIGVPHARTLRRPPIRSVVVGQDAKAEETTTTTVSKNASQGKLGNLGSLMGRLLPARTLREGLGRLRDDGREQRRAPIEPHPSVRKCFRHTVALVLQRWGTRSPPIPHLALGPPARSLRRLLVARFGRRLFTAASLCTFPALQHVGQVGALI